MQAQDQVRRRQRKRPRSARRAWITVVEGDDGTIDEIVALMANLAREKGKPLEHQ
jgi:hypothetical protein